MKNYNYKRAIELIEENKTNLLCASLGMTEDWFWTAGTVWKGNEYKKDLLQSPPIGGICGSHWATPALLLEFSDGTERLIECFYQEGVPADEAKVAENKALWASGPLSQDAQQSLPPLESDGKAQA